MNKHNFAEMTWTEYFLSIAEVIKSKSKDNSTHIGAVIAGKGNEILSTGYNSFPRGIDDSLDERQERPEKYFWMEHAERNSIFNAARIGVSLVGSTIYITSGVPCCDCARGIISSGISKVYCKKTDTTSNRSLWDEHAVRSLQMFKEANVEIIYYE